MAPLISSGKYCLLFHLLSGLGLAGQRSNQGDPAPKIVVEIGSNVDLGDNWDVVFVDALVDYSLRLDGPTVLAYSRSHLLPIRREWFVSCSY